MDTSFCDFVVGTALLLVPFVSVFERLWCCGLCVYLCGFACAQYLFGAFVFFGWVGELLSRFGTYLFGFVIANFVYCLFTVFVCMLLSVVVFCAFGISCCLVAYLYGFVCEWLWFDLPGGFLGCCFLVLSYLVGCS